MIENKMFQIQIHATGSSGNAYSIIDGDHKILIDPGIRFTQLQQATGFTLSQYDFCLLSHEHKDHSRCIIDLHRHGLICALSLGTLNAIGQDDFMSPPIILKAEKPWIYDAWRILPFHVEHDCAEPLGFLIESPSGKKICFATDTVYIRYKFTGVTHWLIEANYSEELLAANESLPEKTKSRIRQSHFEFGNVIKFFSVQDLSKTEEIYLIHPSDVNSDIKKFVDEIKNITGKPVYSSASAVI